MEIKNRSAAPLYVNIAVLATRANVGVETADFFRGEGDNDRTTNFGTHLSAMQLHNLPINTDIYTVLRHKRYKIVAGETGGTNIQTHSGNSYLQLDWFIPFKRQMRWDTNNASPPESGHVNLVYWCDKFENAPGAASQINQMAFGYYCVTSFRDIGE